jgi:hypothetical protein
MGGTLRATGAVALMIGASLGAALPSAADPAATIDDITLDECDIVVTFTVGDAGEYDLEVWDDGVQIGDVPVTAEAGATVEGRYTLTSVVQQGASGLGINIASPDGSVVYDSVDPYNGADDVIDFCSSQPPSTTTPSTSTPETTAPPVTNAPPTNTPAPPVAPPATPVPGQPDFTG